MVDNVKDLIYKKYNLSSYLPAFKVDNHAANESAELKEELDGLKRFISNTNHLKLKVMLYSWTLYNC